MTTAARRPDAYPEPKSWWRHRLGRGIYQVFGVARLTGTEEQLVVYVSPVGRVWVTPLANWAADWETASQPSSDEEDGPAGGERLLSDVIKARVLGKGGAGCCDRYGNMQACDCLSEAVDDLPPGMTVLAYETMLRRDGPVPRGGRITATCGPDNKAWDLGRCGVCNDPNCQTPGTKH